MGQRQRDRELAEWTRTHQLVVRDALGRPLVQTPLDLLRAVLEWGETAEVLTGLSVEPIPPTPRQLIEHRSAERIGRRRADRRAAAIRFWRRITFRPVIFRAGRTE